jgi:hypothetical protein
LITDGLRQKFGPLRVRDFPPDETTLVGAGTIRIRYTLTSPKNTTVITGVSFHTYGHTSHFVRVDIYGYFVGMGLRDVGFTPIVEIPYAKYLDCAMDMFNELVLLHWLGEPLTEHSLFVVCHELIS